MLSNFAVHQSSRWFWFMVSWEPAGVCWRLWVMLIWDGAVSTLFTNELTSNSKIIKSILKHPLLYSHSYEREDSNEFLGEMKYDVWSQSYWDIIKRRLHPSPFKHYRVYHRGIDFILFSKAYDANRLYFYTDVYVPKNRSCSNHSHRI